MVKKSVTIKQEPLFIAPVEQEPVEQEPFEQEPVEQEPVEQEPTELIEPTEPIEQEPEQDEPKPPTPKKKPGRPIGSNSKEPGKPRAKRKIVERPAEESYELENIETPRVLPGSRPIPPEAYDTSSAQMLQLLAIHAQQRQHEKTELYKSWFK